MQGARVQPLIRALDPTYCNWAFVYNNKKIQHAATETMLCAKSLQSCPTLCDPMDVAHQAPLSVRFSGKNTGVGCCASPPGNLPDPGIKPASLTFPALAGRFFTTSATWQLRPGTAKWIIEKKKRQKYSRNKEERTSKSNWENWRRHRGERRGHVWAETRGLSDEHQADGKERQKDDHVQTGNQKHTYSWEKCRKFSIWLGKGR